MEFANLKNVQIKEEPVEQLEDLNMVEAMEDGDTSMIMDVDPMNLLEPVAECSRPDEEGRQDASDYHSDYLTSKGDDSSQIDKWDLWLKTFSWLLRDDESKEHGFCVYCGKKVSVNGVTALQRHNAALIHKERQRNYEAFQSSFRGPNEDGEVVQVKNEFASEKDSDSAELISKRLSLSNALNDFNWEYWLKTHSWLVRHRDEGTKGYCKFCKVEFDMEFSLTRERHEKALKHKLGEKLYYRQFGTDGKDSAEISDNSVDKNMNLKDCDAANDIYEASDKTFENIATRGPCFEKLPQSSNQYRCRLCRVTLDKRSCYKHMKTKIHRRSLQLFKKLKIGKKIIARNDSVKSKAIDWSKYSQIHPWISGDPDNSKYAYCLYCNKRFMYGLSSVKRSLHENSHLHREAMKLKIGHTNDSQMCENISQTQKEYNNSDSESGDAEEKKIDDIKQKHSKRTGFCTDEWFKIHRWYQRNPDNSDYIYCKCCKVLLLIRNFSPTKHEKSERHRILAKQCQDDVSEGEILYADLHIRKRTRTKISWLGYTKSGQNYCKFCRVVLSRKYWPTSHERTERHKLAAQKFLLKKNTLQTETSHVNLAQSESKPEITNDVICQESTELKISIWQQKYSWLSYNDTETREHYAFCTYCKESVFVPTTKFASKHQCTASHIRAGLNLQGQAQLENIIDESEKLNDDGSACEGKLNVFSKGQSFAWLLPDVQNDKSYGYCKYCKIRVLVKGILALSHHNSKNHKLAAQTYSRQQEREAGQSNISMSPSKNANAKLGQHHTNELSKYNEPLLNEDVRSSTEKKSSISLATRLTNAHTEILSLCRELNENRKRKNNILSTAPFSIAACLSPFDPDNVEYFQVSDKTRDQSAHKHSAQENNTYDLFFESMKETVKKLPIDLAAESRVKIMQVVYELEMRALERISSTQNSTNITTFSSLSSGTKLYNTAREASQKPSDSANSLASNANGFIPLNGLGSPKHITLNGEM